MFSFAITPLGNLFFGMSVVVFVSLLFAGGRRGEWLWYVLLLGSLGLVFYADDLVTLFIGWEIMSWSSYFLIARRASSATLQKYIVFNLAAAFALLGALVLIYGAEGSVAYVAIDLSTLAPSHRIAIALLLFGTLFIKSGIVPFHYWVVDTYAQADERFSTVLSAIISKVGIFLFILFFVRFLPAELLPKGLFVLLAWLGVITSIIATFKAIDEDEPKRLLAYSSIAQVGYIITVIALLTNSALEAALYHAVIHTFVKLLLFVNVAAILHTTGRNTFSTLGGLMNTYLLNFLLLVIGIIALAGVPLLGGFSSKFLIYTTLLEAHQGLLLAAVMFSSASAFLYCYKLVYGIYLGQPTHDPEVSAPGRIPWGYYVPQVVGAALLLILGALPGAIVPYVNTILEDLSLAPVMDGGATVLATPFASFNGLVIWEAFVGIFLLILLGFLLLKNRSTRPRDRYDISYCGEVPRPDVNLHYGYGMGRELIRIGGIRTILTHHAHALWGRVIVVAGDGSHLIQRLYSLTAQNIAWLFVAFVTALLYLEVH